MGFGLCFGVIPALVSSLPNSDGVPHTMTSLTALRLLLQGYLNYDWPDEYDDPRMAVDDFARSEPALARVLSDDV